MQLAALGLVDVVGAELGLGADDGGVKVAQGGLPSSIRLVELLHELVAQRAQLRDGGLVHTVGNKNTHNVIFSFDDT